MKVLTVLIFLLLIGSFGYAGNIPKHDGFSNPFDVKESMKEQMQKTA